MKRIVIMATLDTKGEEAAYLRDLILRRGHEPLVVDMGAGGEPRGPADITAAEVARAAGADIETFRGRDPRKREAATDTMIRGAVKRLRSLWEAGQVEGIVSLGGVTSAVMASSVMKEMPFRIPKLILTSGASLTGAHRFFGPTGVTVMHSLVEVGGLNRLLKEHLARAAAAICAMVEAAASTDERAEQKPAVAMSTNGWVELCAQRILRSLELGYEVIRFHATGVPEVVMEKLIEEDYFCAVIDLVPSSITNERFNGSRISWPRRLEVAGERGIPQVVAPCLVNAISRIRDGSQEEAAEMAMRKHYVMDDLRILLWLKPEELKDMAAVYAEKLNKAKGPTKFLIPMKGWASMETEGTDLYDPDGIRAFVDGLKGELKPEVEVREVDANIESEPFAEAVLAAFEEVTVAAGACRLFEPQTEG